MVTCIYNWSLFQGKPGCHGTPYLLSLPLCLVQVGCPAPGCSLPLLDLLEVSPPHLAPCLPPSCIWHHVLFGLGFSGISGCPRMHAPSLGLGHGRFCAYIMACPPGTSHTISLFLKRDFSERCVLFLSYIWDSEACFLVCSDPLHLVGVSVTPYHGLHHSFVVGLWVLT